MRSISAYLQIVRFPNLFTAIADSAAGYLIVSGTQFRGTYIILLAVTSAGAYAGGCVLNDYCDRSIDAIERHERPIPSGRVTPRGALLLGGACFVISLGSGLAIGLHQLIITAILVGLVILYDAGTKQSPLLGPLTMGMCRAANLTLGLSLILPATEMILLFPVMSLFYVAWLTYLSRFEVNGENRHSALLFTAWMLTIACLVVISLRSPSVYETSAFVLLFLFLTSPALIRAFRLATPASVGSAIKYLVLGIPFLDAIYVSAVQGWLFAMPVAACSLAALFFSKRLAMT